MAERIEDDELGEIDFEILMERGVIVFNPYDTTYLVNDRALEKLSAALADDEHWCEDILDPFPALIPYRLHCTREKGHTGVHIAHDESSGQPIAVWRNDSTFRVEKR